MERVGYGFAGAEALEGGWVRHFGSVEVGGVDGGEAMALMLGALV